MARCSYDTMPTSLSLHPEPKSWTFESVPGNHIGSGWRADARPILEVTHAAGIRACPASHRCRDSGEYALHVLNLHLYWFPVDRPASDPHPRPAVAWGAFFWAEVPIHLTKRIPG